ncbi:MAG TPA: hypothetical protein VHX66_15340 [Solirubrobacteraceae bacterium]|jgi:hypothetical protein|nr:hypothetical protein [Solirubrobacteraceae bacterium]
MGTAVAGEAYAGPPPKDPGYGRLFGPSVFALLFGTVCLFALVSALSLSTLVGVNSGTNLLLYEPWVIDGPWALAASVAWAALVSALIGSILVARVKTRVGVSLSRELCWASVAIGGYLPWLVTTSQTERLAFSLFLTPAVLRFVAFDGAAQPRRLPARIIRPRRYELAALLCVVVGVIGPYSLLHPLSVHGTGQSGGTLTNGESGSSYVVAPGEPVQAEVGLQAGIFPITVTGARLVGLPSDVRVIRVSRGSDPALLHQPQPARFSTHVAARHSLWFGYAVALKRCPIRPVAITRIRLSYRELGLSLTQTVPLAGSNTLLSCN